MVDAPPRDVGHVQQAVDAAEIDEGAVVGDVLDHAFENLAFLETGKQLGALLGPRFFQNGAAGNDDIAASAIHLEDLERLGLAHQRADVADRTDVDLAARQERDGARKINRETALYPTEDGAADTLIVLERLFQLRPSFLAPRALAAQHRFAVAILHPLEIDVDPVADLNLRLLAGGGEFLELDPSFGLEPHIDQDRVAIDGQHGAFDDRAFRQLAVGKCFLEKSGEVLGCRGNIAAG